MALCHPPQFGFADLRRQHVDDLRTELVLYREELADGTIEALGPKLSAGVLLRQVNVHVQTVVDALDHPGDEVPRLRAARDVAAGPALQRRKADDGETRRLREIGKEIRGDAPRERQFLSVLAQRLEGQDRNRRWLRQIGNRTGTQQRPRRMPICAPPDARREQQGQPAAPCNPVSEGGPAWNGKGALVHCG